MQVPLAESTWSTPPVDPDVTADHHLGTFIRWLQSAGAEPRLALGLCSGPRARAKMHTVLLSAGVEVIPTPATTERPIHADVMAHQGDHFNSTLFVVGGFDQTDLEEVFCVLDGQRGQLSRVATWVLLLVESTTALEALYTHAPNLARTIMRRCLLIGPDVIDAPGRAVSADLKAAWRREGRIAELLFNDAMNPRSRTDYATFSRLVRSGYASQLSAVSTAQHAERRALMDIWEGRDLSLRGPPTASVAEALVRHAAATTLQKTAATAALADRPEVRFAIGLDVAEDPLWGPLAAVRRAADRGESMTPAAWATLRADAAPAALGVRVLVEETISRAAAAAGDFDACVGAMERAVGWAHGAPPELRFDVLEKAAQLYTFMERPGPANAALSLLEKEVPGLVSPFYAGRLALALARFFGQRDPVVARKALSRAAVLFSAHGHPDWAEDVARRQDDR